MLSIIICSRDSGLFQKATANVADTIGVPYEIIRVDNANGSYGICAAYNKGARQSRYGLLCFMHEDILFRSPAWGKTVARTLSQPKIGLLGVTGSKYLVDAPAPWWGAGPEYCRRNVLEHYADDTTAHILQNPDNLEAEEVIAVDGLWMCTRKEVWEKHPFDESRFPYFHIYDIDFSMQIAQHYKVLMTYEILIEHLSGGTLNKPWVAGSIAFYDKWKKALPIKTEDAPPANRLQKRGEAYLKFCDTMLASGYSRAATWKYMLKSFWYNGLDKRQLWMIRALLSPKAAKKG